jgi:outer membrane protein insertion porin family
MRPRPLCLGRILVVLLWLAAATNAFGGAPAAVIGVELVSPHQLPTDLVRAAIGNLVGRPRSRLAIRDALERLWSLGLFTDVRVEETADADGVRLRFHFVRRPFIRRVAWEGDLGLPDVDLAEAAGLAVGGDADPERLEHARRNILAALAREGYFAARADIRTQDDPATNGRDLTIILQAGARTRIGTVDFRAVGEADVAALRKSLKLDSGKDYRERTVRERAQNLEDELRQDGYFEARVSPPKAVWDAASNQVNIQIEVERGPQYQVEFQGIGELSESALRARLPFKESGAVDETEVATSAREIEAAYRESGFHFVRVSGSLHGTGDSRVIRFDVTEGPRVTVEAINLSGNHTVPTKQLTGRLATQLPGVFQPGLFRQDLLDQDLLTLAALYRGQGFPDVTVGPPEVRFSEDQRHARIVIPINEGPRLRVGRVTVEGARIRSPEEVLAAMPVKSGDPWTAPKGTEARRAIGRLYAERGYLNAQVTMHVTRSDVQVDLVFQINEGSPTQVGRILVGGLIATREAVVRREIPFKPGDPFNPELLVETERRLGRLGLFERVQVGPLRPPQTPFADVEITLREGKPWRVEAGGGYDTDRGWGGLLEIGHDNLFGTARSASVRERLTEDGDRTDLTFRTPWLLGRPLKGDLTLFREQWQELGYRRQGAGVTTGIQREFFQEPLTDIYRLRVGLRYQLEWVRRYDIVPSLLTVSPETIVEGSQIIGRIIPAVTLDYRDNVLDPTRGSLHTLSVDLAGVYLGSQVSFVKSRIETAWYLDWLSPVILAVGARVGLAGPYANSAALPIEDRFYAGGGSTVRGYPEDKIGPLDALGNPTGGNALMVFNLEGRFPIWRWLSGVVFMDTGAVTPEISDLGRAAFKTGVGGGLRVKTPVGPIRLDIGYALNGTQGEDRWQLYFGIGQAF